MNDSNTDVKAGEEKKVQLQFLLLTLLGAITIFSVTLLKLDTPYAIALPLIPMGIYIFLTWRHRGVALTEEQIGDSYYYMGFLYTLFTIIASLIWLGFLTQVGDGDMRQLLGRFGLALIATSVGMGARLMLVQFRLDDTQAPKILRENVSQALRELSSELQLGLKYFRDIRVSAATSLESALEKAGDSLKNIETDRGKKLDKLFDDFSKRQHGILTQLESKVNNLKLEPERLRDELDRSVKGIDQALAGLKRSIEEAGNAALSQGSGLKDATDELCKTAEALKSLNASASNLASMGLPLSQTAQSLSKISDAAAQLAPALNRSVSELNAPIQMNLDDARKTSANMQTELEVIRGLRQQILNELHEASEATTKVLQYLAAHGEHIIERLGGEHGVETSSP